MAQDRIFQFHDFDAAATHNARLARVIEPGVYRGYWPVPNAFETNVIDLTLGGDTDSRLVTSEGITIIETTPVLGAVRVGSAHSTFTRKDLLVARYEFSNDPKTPATYEIIRGANQTALDEEPVVPNPGANDTPIAVIVVRPPASASGSGTTTAQIAQTDILPLPRASETRHDEMSSLKPTVDPVARNRLFVQAGNFLNSGRDAIVQFKGAYSEVITDAALIAGGSSLYYLFAVADDETVSIAASAATAAGLPAIATDVVPVAIVEARRNSSGIVEIIGLNDVRTPISRATQPVSETEKYRTALVNSVLKYGVIDPITDAQFLDLSRVGFDAGASTALTTDEDLTAEIITGNSSLRVAYGGDPGTAEAGVTTLDLMDGIAAQVGPLSHFMIQMDFSEGVTFDYSISGPDTGYTGNRYTSGSLISVPRTTTAATRLFVRFFFSRTILDAGDAISLFSYAAFLQLNNEQLNDNVINELGLNTVTSLVPNLIANGDFRYWSRIDNDSLLPDIDASDQIDYPYSTLADDITNNEKMFAADGWMFTQREYAARDAVVSRIIKSTALDGAEDTALEFIGEAGVVGPKNILEYRVPRVSDMQGHFVSFAFDVTTTLAGSVGGRITFYRRGADGVLVTKHAIESTLAQASGQVILTSGEAVGPDVTAIGFGIVFAQSTAEVTFTVERARASLGEFRVLPYNRHPTPQSTLRYYYERGRLVSASDTEAESQIAASQQMQASKHSSLVPNQTIRARVLGDSSFDRSSNVQSQTIQVADQSIIGTAIASSTGAVRIDVDWEAEVIYTQS